MARFARLPSSPRRGERHVDLGTLVIAGNPFRCSRAVSLDVVVISKNYSREGRDDAAFISALDTRFQWRLPARFAKNLDEVGGEVTTLSENLREFICGSERRV